MINITLHFIALQYKPKWFPFNKLSKKTGAFDVSVTEINVFKKQIIMYLFSITFYTSCNIIRSITLMLTL